MRWHYLVEWIDIRGLRRETYVRAIDAHVARGQVTRNSDVKRIVAVSRMNVPAAEARRPGYNTHTVEKGEKQ
jgi:hypothetical protein